MIQAVMDEEQLRAALAAIEKSKERGFRNSLAVVWLRHSGECVEDCILEYCDLILKGHPTDDCANWNGER
jgi:hypothetical protein